jgi:hypothetical protein
MAGKIIELLIGHVPLPVALTEGDIILEYNGIYHIGLLLMVDGHC